MFGTHKQLITKTCVTCQKVVAMRVDPQDIQRHREGVLVQDAFADRAGVPYLNAGEREMFISGVCDDCFRLLCPSDRLAYS